MLHAWLVLVVRTRLVIRLMHFDNGPVRILQEDLVPATHRPNAVIGKGNVLLAQQRLERFYVISAERNMAAVERVEALLGSECHAEILRGDMKLGRSVR